MISCTEKTGAGILELMPAEVRKELALCDISDAEEIRLRLNRRVCVVKKSKSYFSGKRCVKKSDIEEAVTHLTGGSICASHERLEGGFLTAHGCRVGLSGSASYEKDKLSGIKNITGLNYRIAREVKGCADKVMPYISDGENLNNVLVISPPCCGKTTLLRDIARQVSDMGFKTTVVDEREEICAWDASGALFDVGKNTDTLSGYFKKDAFPIAIRTLSPNIIVTDELGGKEDENMIEFAVSRGVYIAASIHAFGFSDISENLKNLFNRFIILGRKNGVGTVEDVICRD